MKGTQTSFPASVELSSLTPATGFILNGVSANDQSGCSVSDAGDINGDGISDLIIGAVSASASYVVFGKSGIGSSGILALSSLNGSNGFVLSGVAGSDSGWSVSGAGDINADGVADLIIGAIFANSQAGASYVVFGKSGIGSSGSLALSSLNGSNGFVLSGITVGDGSGHSVSGVGDINGDGVADLIVGAPYANSEAGASYVVFGKPGIGSSGSLTLSSLNGSNGFVLPGVASSYSGRSVSGAGDVNGDGVADLIIGAYGANSVAGASYVVFGKPGIGSSASLALSSLNGSNGFVLPGVANSVSGFSVSGAGDVNGDGVADLIIGAYGANSVAGASYVVFGKPGIGSSGSLTLSSLNGPNGFVLPGVASSYSGVSVSGAGDINGDGVDDLIIGAYEANSLAGASYVVFGKPGIGSSGGLALSSLNGNNGFVLNGVAGSQIGLSVSSAGDVNADGVADLIIGAPDANSYAGASYLVFGGAIISLLSNQLMITKGQTVLFNSNNLNATYEINSAWNPNILFTVSQVQHGYFSLTNDTFVPITRFLQQQVRNGQVQFIHDDEPLSPSYNVQIENGLSMLLQPASITFIHQGAKLTTNQLAINQGQTITFFSNQLSAIDLDNPKDNPTLIFSVSAVQHGYFQQVGNPGYPITSFIQSQLQTGGIQFVPDGSTSAPGYSVAVSDGSLTTTPQASAISFNLRPTLGNNTLTLNQGQTVVLTSAMLSATDLDDPAPDLTFMVSNIQHGQFELVSSPGNSITYFIQAQIQNGTVQFVQDGTVYAPSDQVAVSDGKMVISPQATKISFNAAPVLINNQLTINQGQTIIVTGIDLSATDPDNNAPSLMFIVSNLLHGQFELVSSPGSAIANFTQAQVQSGAIQFVQDSGAIAPSYRVGVSEGKMTIPSQPSIITFDASPVLTINSLAVSQGQTVLLSPVNLAASDPDNSAASLNFLVSGVQHGYFQSLSNFGLALTSFIQSEVQNGVIQFVTDGSASAPSYEIAVSDGIITTPAQSSVVTFNIAPTLINNSLTVNQGQPVILTSNNLSAIDPDNSLTSLIFMVNEVQYGHFEVLTNRGVVATSFSQGQIQNGQVQFIPDGSINPPLYSVAVSDGKVSSLVQFSNVTFNLAPVLVNNAFTVKQGQTLTLTPADISATQGGSAVGSLTFIISTVTGGHFQLTSAPGIVITTFTQAQIQEGAVQFVQDGSATAPSYRLMLSNGLITTASQPSTVSFDSLPILEKNTLTITQGQTLILTSDQLSASDQQTPNNELIFSAIDVTHGYFEDVIVAPGVAATQFAQQRIASGAIKFVTDGSSDAPAYNISVGDGVLSTPSSAAIVNFSPVAETTTFAENITLRNTVIGAVVSGVIGLGFFGFQLWVKHKAHQRLERATAESDGVGKQQVNFHKNVIRPVAKSILARIQVAGFMGYVSDKTMHNAISAISSLVHELEKRKVVVDLQTLSSAQQRLLLDTIARQVQQQLVPDRLCCSPSRLFCPEVTPSQIEENIIPIANAVKRALEDEVAFVAQPELKDQKNLDDSSHIDLPSVNDDPSEPGIELNRFNLFSKKQPSLEQASLIAEFKKESSQMKDQLTQVLKRVDDLESRLVPGSQH